MIIVSWNVQGKHAINFVLEWAILRGVSVVVVLEPSWDFNEHAATYFKKPISSRSGGTLNNAHLTWECEGYTFSDINMGQKNKGDAKERQRDSIFILYRKDQVTLGKQAKHKVQGLAYYKPYLVVPIHAKQSGSSDPAWTLHMACCHAPFDSEDRIAATSWVKGMMKQADRHADVIMGDLNLYEGGRQSGNDAFVNLMPKGAKTSSGGYPLDQVWVKKALPGRFSLTVNVATELSVLASQSVSRGTKDVGSKRKLDESYDAEDAPDLSRSLRRRTTRQSYNGTADHAPIFLSLEPWDVDDKQLKKLLEHTKRSSAKNRPKAQPQGIGVDNRKKKPEPPQEPLRRALSATYDIVSNAGGGNCLFLSVAQGLGTAEDDTRALAGDLRLAAVQFVDLYFDAQLWALNDTDDGFEAEKEDHLDYMRRDGAWAGDYELAALSFIVDAVIIVHSVDHHHEGVDHPIPYDPGTGTAKRLHLYHNGYHYEWMRPRGGGAV